MYKTIRHGENSLQYTILPQQEDSNGSSGVRRRGTILIITLVLACGVVGAAVVVPLLLSTDLSAFQRVKAHHRHNPHHSKIVPVRHNFTTTTSTTTEVSDLANTTALDIGGMLDDVGTDHEAGSSRKKALQEEVLRNITTSSSTTPVVTVLNTTLEEITTQATTTTSSSTFSTTTTTTITTTTTVPSSPHPKDRSWLQPRWPFADPSSYFQWTGYNGQDSLLLPLILGAAMLILLLAICICYSIRRRRQKKLRRQTIGKISTDLQCGDKTTLLPDGSEEE